MATGIKTPRTKVSVRVPTALSERIQAAMARDQISPRKLSDWISGALAALLNLGARRITERHLLTGASLDAGGPHSITLPITLDDDLHLALISLIAEIRQVDPFSNVSQSALIRAAILQRLQEGEGA